MNTKNPLEIVGITQEDNRRWWEENPMTYQGWDGGRQIEYSEDDPRFYRTIDSIFFAAAKHFSTSAESPKPFSRLINFDCVAGKRVLEIGCGQGSHAELLARAGAHYTGIDITETAVRRTRRRFQLSGLNGQILQLDAEKMAFAADSFDFVWSWGVIHHSYNTQNIVDEIYRVLVPGGRAQVMVYHKNSLRYYVRGGIRDGLFKGKLLRMSLYEINKRFTDGAIAHHYSRDEAKRMFGRFSQVEAAVMDGEQEAYIPILGKVARKAMPRLMRRIDAALQKRWGWFLYIEATK